MIRKRATVAALATIAASVPAHAAVTISSAQTQNMTCSAGVCSPTAKKAVLNVSDLENMLSSGDIEVTTKDSEVQASNIHVKAPFGWSSANTLSLDARRAIEINQAVSVTGSGGMSIAYKSGGSLLFGSKGSVGFSSLSSSLAINGQKFVLVNSIAALASAIANKPLGKYALANSYDASQDGIYTNSPISTILKGRFEGLGNTISNLSINHNVRGRANIGLFVELADSGVIENIALTKEKISVSRDDGNFTGGLVGINRGLLFGDRTSGSIEQSHCCKSIGEDAGGLVGANAGTIMLSSANVRIRTTSTGGGLAGVNNEGKIILSHASGDVMGAKNGGPEVGGLVGGNFRATVTESYATGSVTGGDGSLVGGLVGYIAESGDINNSYAIGAVTGGASSTVGGFIGWNDSGTSIESSYSTGVVSGGTGSLVGGFSGTKGIFADCYWDTDTSGTDQGTGFGNQSGLTGLTTEQLQSGLPPGFDPAIWNEQAAINNGFPYLIGMPPPK